MTLEKSHGRRLRTLARSLSLLILASPLFAEEVDLNSTTADIVLTAGSAGVNLTQSNQALAKGDLDHDGEIDLVIGGAGSLSASTLEDGDVYVVFGPLTSSSIDLATSAADIVVTGLSNSMLGYAVAVGDVSNDGYDDLIVSAPKADGPGGSGRTDSGSVYVFYGPLSSGTLSIGSGDADLIIYGKEAGDELGHAIAIGNISGSSANDLALGAPNSDGYNNANADAGEVAVLNGPLSTGTWDLASTSPNVIIWGEGGSHLHQVAIGEVSGDSDADIVLGAPSEPMGTKGLVYSIFGPITSGSQINVGYLTPYDFVTGWIPSFASDVLIADFDNDGQNDVLAVARHANENADYGAVFGFLGPLPLSITDDAMLTADLRIDFPDFANATGDVTSIAFGDVSDDGIGDLLIGSIAGSGPDDNRTYAGQVNVFYGPVEPRIYDLTQEISQVVVYGASGARVGYDVIAADMNGDDNGDLIALAPTQSTVSGSAGKVHILSGTRCFFDPFNDGTLASSWTLTELGSADQGVATESGGYLDLEGDGTGISGTSDDAVYLWRNDLTGDFRIEATIVDVPGNTGGSFRRGGLWVRASDTEAGYSQNQAPGVSITYFPLSSTLGTGELRFRMRKVWGGDGNISLGSNIIQASNTNTFVLPVRVAIERIGSSYCVSYLKNEGNPRWVHPAGGVATNGCTSGSNNPDIDNQPQIGLMTGANHASTTATFRYDDFSACFQ